MHVLVKPNASTHDMMRKELMYINQMVLVIIFPFRALPTRKQYRFIILTKGLLLLNLYFAVCKYLRKIN